MAQSGKYDHILFYAHGGLNSITDSAKRVLAMKEVFKDNRVYPYHFIYDTGLLEELKDIVLRKLGIAEDRVGGLTDWTDRLIEKITRPPGRALWREMKRGARLPFDEGRAGWQLLEALIHKLQLHGSAKKLHLVGHSTGGILLAHLLQAVEVLAPSVRIQSVSLMAPAATIDLFKTHYYPLLVEQEQFFGIDKMTVYNLKDALEKDDNVAGLYRKSLLYLVSRAFEEDSDEELLGMARYSRGLDRKVGKAVDFVYSDGAGSERTSSTSHLAFDNDPNTMNDILRIVLKKKPVKPFTEEDLDYG